MPTPTQKFDMIYSEFLKWKNEDPENRGFWAHRKALHYRKNTDLYSRRRKRRS